MKKDGFILLTTMLFIFVSTLLILSLMQCVLLYSQEARQRVTNHKAFHDLELEGEQLDINQFDCIVSESNPNQLVLNVLKHRGCTKLVEKQKWLYSIADLGLYPCLPIVIDKKKYASHHWLITLSSEQVNKTLQFRIVKPSDVVALCNLSYEHIISQGVVSWRLLG